MNTVYFSQHTAGSQGSTNNNAIIAGVIIPLFVFIIGCVTAIFIFIWCVLLRKVCVELLDGTDCIRHIYWHNNNMILRTLS